MKFHHMHTCGALLPPKTRSFGIWFGGGKWLRGLGVSLQFGRHTHIFGIEADGQDVHKVDPTPEYKTTPEDIVRSVHAIARIAKESLTQEQIETLPDYIQASIDHAPMGDVGL